MLNELSFSVKSFSSDELGRAHQFFRSSTHQTTKHLLLSDSANFFHGHQTIVGDAMVQLT